MIKLIVSDIDGTLLPYGSAALDEKLFELILRLRERGVIFCPASGRQYHSLRALFAPVCDELTYLCENGAIVYGPGPEDKAAVLGKTVMDRETALDLVRDIKGNNVAVIDRPEDVPEDIIKLATYCPEGTGPTRHALGPKWDGRLSMCSAGPDWVDFTIADKALGLETLCAALGVDPGECAAFGDNWNDAPMLKKAGRGYIMATSDPNLRAQFALQCENVEKVLENFLETGEI